MFQLSSICLVVLLFSVSLLSCGSNSEQPPEPVAKKQAETSGGEQEVYDTNAATAAGMSDSLVCQNVDTAPKALLKSQTFAIDFEPFKNSCFVTSHDPEFKDPPLGAEFAIYTSGKKVEAFHGDFPVTMGNPVKAESKVSLPTGCWVEAVAFQNINEDPLADVIVVNKCAGKSGTYNENIVFINNSKLLVSRSDANSLLTDLKTIKEIVAYIKGNPKPFSLIVDAASNNSQP